MYYRLTYCKAQKKGKVGDSVLCGYRPLTIGQLPSCDLIIGGESVYEPQEFATILPVDGGEGWYVVCRSDSHEVMLNGKKLSVAATLKNGDMLSFSEGGVETVLKFNTFEDGDYDSSTGIVYKTHRSHSLLTTIISLFSLLIVALVASKVYFSNNRDVKLDDINPHRESVWRIVADSVYLMTDTLIDGQIVKVAIDSVSLEMETTGTCFLTADSLLVTARHCIEPWINDMGGDLTVNWDLMPSEVQLAIKAETLNQELLTHKYSLRTHCVIYDNKDAIERSCYSDDFFMNKTRDKILTVGDIDNPMFLRTIFPIAQRRNMELGDFAYMRFDRQGTIQLADIEDIRRLWADEDNRSIMLWGYPKTDRSEITIVNKEGNLQGVQYDMDSIPSECLQMSPTVDPGFSGGPVFASIDGTVKVIGIVSKADANSQHDTFWAVPSSEVTTMHREWNDKVEDDGLFFTR